MCFELLPLYEANQRFMKEPNAENRTALFDISLNPADIKKMALRDYEKLRNAQGEWGKNAQTAWFKEKHPSTERGRYFWFIQLIVEEKHPFECFALDLIAHKTKTDNMLIAYEELVNYWIKNGLEERRLSFFERRCMPAASSGKRKSDTDHNQKTVKFNLGFDVSPKDNHELEFSSSSHARY